MFGSSVVTGEDYEKYVAKVLKREGFRKIQFTPVTADYGVDLIAKRNGLVYAVQCKYYTGAVSGHAVQEAVAGMGYYQCDRALVVTNSFLTRNAHALADANQVEIMEYIQPETGIIAPWHLILLAVQCVAFGLYLLELLEQDLFSWRLCGVAALYCFPLPFLLIGFCLLLWRLFCCKRSGQDPDE